MDTRPTFADLGLPTPLVDELTSQGLIEPFPIQQATIADALAGRDTLGRGRTGSGKTLAFTLPLLARLLESNKPRENYAPRALILVPTRELANQVCDVLAPLARRLGMRTTTVYGGVGYPKPDRSHFTSMAIWQSGAPITKLNSGWLGRWVESQQVDPMLAISLGSVLPPLLAGEKRSGSALPLGGLVIPTGTFAKDCQKLAKVASSDNKLMAAAATSMRTLFSVSNTVTPVLKMPAPVSDELPTVNGGNAGGDSNLAQQLDVVAKLIAAGSPTRVWSVSLGGFDTHANEANAQAELLGVVSDSLSRFMGQLKATTRSNDVTIMVYSEFGRRVAGNGSQGTDHGTSGPMFVIGNSVKGGFYGEQPSLKNLFKGDLAVTTDFRDVYATVIEKVLKSPVGPTLGSWAGRVNCLN